MQFAKHCLTLSPVTILSDVSTPFGSCYNRKPKAQSSMQSEMASFLIYSTRCMDRRKGASYVLPVLAACLCIYMNLLFFQAKFLLQHLETMHSKNIQSVEKFANIESLSYTRH